MIRTCVLCAIACTRTKPTNEGETTRPTPSYRTVSQSILFPLLERFGSVYAVLRFNAGRSVKSAGIFLSNFPIRHSTRHRSNNRMCRRMFFVFMIFPFLHKISEIEYFPFISRDEMKRRTLSGSCGVGIFVIAFVCICIAFATPSWIVSDYRITGAKLDRLGLWTHCFRSLPDVNDDYQRRFFVGCRWVFDPFTTGYDEIRGFLIPRKYQPCAEYVHMWIVN